MKAMVIAMELHHTPWLIVFAKVFSHRNTTSRAWDPMRLDRVSPHPCRMETSHTHSYLTGSLTFVMFSQLKEKSKGKKIFVRVCVFQQLFLFRHLNAAALASFMRSLVKVTLSRWRAAFLTGILTWIIFTSTRLHFLVWKKIYLEEK